MMSSRFNKGLYFLIGADINDLKLSPILSLSPRLMQCVNEPTHNSSILDIIITDLHSFYQVPQVLDPLDADNDSGEASDHKMVLMKPLETIDDKRIIENKTRETRIFSEENFQSMGGLLQKLDWSFLKTITSVNKRMEVFNDTLFGQFDQCFPLKKKIIFSQNIKFHIIMFVYL